MPNLKAPPPLGRPASLRLPQHIRPNQQEYRWNLAMSLIVLVKLASLQLCTTVQSLTHGCNSCNQVSKYSPL